MGNPQSKDQSGVSEDFVKGKSYKGETKFGKRHGKGVYLYPNGDMYDGEWRKSKRDGKGVLVLADGHRQDGYFYKDDFLGKEPNEKIKRRMAKKKARGQADNCTVTEQSDLSNGKLDDKIEPQVKLKAHARARSFKRTKWVRDKYGIGKDESAESLDTPKSRSKNSEEFADSSKNMKQLCCLGKNDEAVERRNSKRLRESIRKKYNLPVQK